MKNYLCLTLAGVMFIAGCGGRVANPIPIYRPGDEGRSCTGLKTEIAQLDADMQRILPKTDKSGTNVVCGVAGAFLIVPWFFMDFKGADKIEFDAMRNRYNYLVSIAAEKQCSMVGVQPILSDKEMKEQLEAQNKETKTLANSEFKKCGNCGSVIGSLEKPYTFEKHVVCRDCYDKLTAHADAGE
ncbi:MAG: hypothetical protein K9M75_03440 [Phycisphaerae bacterium]|nr:hypothetical protein [Phycisphaerae bacterium]